MLISHSRRFIYLKTVKTAGTSVEAYFEKHCLPPDQQEFKHLRESYEGPAGVVGFRGPVPKGRRWFNHMDAASIREKIPAAQWNDYFKFCVIRDPFDKLVSGFHMFDAKLRSKPWSERLRTCWRRFRGIGSPIERAVGSTPVERFRSWIKLGGMIDDRAIYTLEGEYCPNYFIRFEQLTDGLREVCHRLGIEFNAGQLPQLKSGFRKGDISLADYYDDECVAAVERVYSRELKDFGYHDPRLTRTSTPAH
jgi:hypothetical protein